MEFKMATAENIKTITDEVKYDLLILCVKVLDNIYPEISYNLYKKKFYKEFSTYIVLPLNYSEKYVNKNIYDVKNELINNIKTCPLFKEDLYSIPLFILTFSIKDGSYDSRNSFLIRNLAQTLKLNPLSLEKYKDQMLTMIDKSRESENATFKTDKYKKYCKIAGASIIGGTLLGLTGGIIAPFLAASSGIILGSTGAAMLGTTAGISIIGSLFGLTGATLTGYKMNKRSGLISEFRFQSLDPPSGKKENGRLKSLCVTIAVSGWINKDCDFATPWRDLRITRERYTLCWESEYLLNFGHGINYLVQWATGTLVQEVLQETVLSALLSSVAWPITLISLAGVIDNPWGVCFARSRDIGKELANVLLSRVAGRRPVTLIGFSLGARVIYHALNYLAQLLPKRKTASARAAAKDLTVGDDTDVSSVSWNTGSELNRSRITSKSLKNLTAPKNSVASNPKSQSEIEDGRLDLKDPRGIIEDVILLGAPIPARDNETYAAWLDVVGGKLTNCYCRTDWILKFLYRTSSAQISVAGLEPLICRDPIFAASTPTMPRQQPTDSNPSSPTDSQHPRVLNIDVSSIVTGHNDYVGKMGHILKTLGYHTDFYRDEE